MSKFVEVVLENGDGFPPERQPDYHEEGMDVPLNSINPDALRNLIAGFEFLQVRPSSTVLLDTIEQSFIDDSIKEQLLPQSQTWK